MELLLLAGLGYLGYYAFKNKDSLDSVLNKTVNNTVTNNDTSNVSDSKLNGLTPKMKEVVTNIIADGKKEGVTFVIAEGFRSVERQNALYAQGRTTKGQIVTFVKGKAGKHTQGKAVDLDYLDANGKQKILTAKQWNVLGKLAKKYGARWGGSWQDYRHIEVS